MRSISHFTAPGRIRATRAFTLIELLVVIGLIAVLAGGIGLAFSGGDRANALQGAQGTLQSVLSAVRGQAALAGQDAALFVNTESSDEDFDTERFLRSFVIAVNNAGNWTVVGDEITLPAGIYLVPRSTGSAFNGKAVVANEYGTAVSDGFASQLTPLYYSDGSTTYPGAYSLVVRLSARGGKQNDGASGSNLVLSPAERGPSSINFEQPDLVRGAMISSYGILTPINDASGF